MFPFFTSIDPLYFVMQTPPGVFAFFNSFVYFFSLFFGTLIFAFLLIPLKAFFFNTLDLIVIFFRVEASIDVTLFDNILLTLAASYPVDRISYRKDS